MAADNYSSGRKSRWVFTARLFQLILGPISIGFASALLVTLNERDPYWMDYDVYHTSSPLAWIALPPVALSSMISLLGAMGMWWHKRPDDVHWHLTLTLDWFNLAISWSNLGLCAALFPTLEVMALSVLCTSFLLALASLPPVIVTHRLKKRGVLPARISSNEIWHSEEAMPIVDESVSTHAQRQSNLQREPTHAQRQPNLQREPSKAVSAAGTAVRWSGATQNDSTSYPSMKSDAEVPPYSGHMSPVRSVVYPKY